MTNPYEKLPEKAFWRTAVAQKAPEDIAGLWDPKRDIRADERIATFGSCFAQHISRALLAKRYHWFDAEPAPAGLAAEQARERNYGIFSARTGNIYTAAALRQWIDWALGRQAPPAETWEKDGRHYDPFRPAIEPGGFASAEEVLRSRGDTLRALERVVKECRHFVFTLGLTEAWINRDSGYVYAMCPGTTAGEFDERRHAFLNFDHARIIGDMRAVIATLHAANPRIGILLTVSPVPLTASASGKHVLTATTYSKSVLRGVAGELADKMEVVDYFPSYEIISGAPWRARYFADNLRSVKPEGVEFVMQSFFACLQAKFAAAPAAAAEPAAAIAEGDDEGEEAVCEEEILAAFAPSARAPRPSAPGALKVCVIGNSHIAALRLAVNEGLFADAGMNLVFWGFPRDKFRKIRMTDGAFVPPDRNLALLVSDGRYETIRPEEFDVLLFVGGGFNTSMTLRWLKERIAAEKLPEAMLVRRLEARLSEAPLMRLIRSIPKASRPRILFVPTPLVSEESGGAPLEVTAQDLERMNRGLAAALERHGVIYVPQPAATIRDNKSTRAEFWVGGIGAIGPDSSHKGRGFKHMNARYGSLILATVRDRLLQPA